MEYKDLISTLDQTWLKNNPNHPYNRWITKPQKSKERIFLSRLDIYLQKIASLLQTKTIQSKLRNPAQFVDTYYELEVACHLIDNRFDVDLEKTLFTEASSHRSPDIFVEADKVIVEVKTLRRGIDVEKGLRSGRAFSHDESNRIKGGILSELEKYMGKGIRYPLAVIVCPDFIEPPYVSTDDFENILIARCDKWVFNGKLYRTPDFENKGLYYDDEGKQASILSGVGLWERNRIIFWQNPNVSKNLKISHGRFLNFLLGS